MLNWVKQRLCSDLAIDLGTTATRIGLPREGIRIDEPSVVAVPRNRQGKGVAVGKLAHQMLGRTPDSISAVKPVQHGVISDFELTELMLRYFIRKASGQSVGARPRVVIAVPGGITEVERRAVFNSAERAGAGQVWLIEESRAAGIGAGLPVSEPLASMVCDIGGGTTEVAVMSLGDIVASRSIRVAGDSMDRTIIQYLRRRYSLRIGEQSAEQLKLRIGSALRWTTSSVTKSVAWIQPAEFLVKRSLPAKKSAKPCTNLWKTSSTAFVERSNSVSPN